MRDFPSHATLSKLHPIRLLCVTASHHTLVMLILCVNLTGLKDVQVAGEKEFLDASVSVFPAEINI